MHRRRTRGAPRRILVLLVLIALVVLGLAPYQSQPEPERPTFVLVMEIDHALSATDHTTDGAGCVGSDWAIEPQGLVWSEAPSTRSTCTATRPLHWPIQAQAATLRFDWAATPESAGSDCLSRAAAAAVENAVWLHLKLHDRDTATVFADRIVYEGNTQEEGTETLRLPQGAVPRSAVDLEWHARDSEVEGVDDAPLACQVPYLRVTPHTVTYHIEHGLEATTSALLSDLAGGTDGHRVDALLRLTRPVIEGTSAARAWVEVPDGRYRLDALHDDDGTRVEVDTGATLTDSGWRIHLPEAATQALLVGPVRLTMLDTTTAPGPSTGGDLVWPAVLLAVLDGWIFPTAIAYSLRYAHRAGAAEKRPVLVYASVSTAATLGALVALVPLILQGGLAQLTMGAMSFGNVAALGLATVSLLAAGGAVAHMRRYGLPALAARERRQAAERAASAKRAEELELFVSGLGHDLKTPLLALDWLTKDVEAELQSGDPVVIQESFSRIRANVGGMDRLVHDLLDMTRVDRGEYDEVAVDVRDVVNDALATLEEARAQNGTRIHVDQRSLPILTGDHALYRQVFQNLIGNAIKYGRSPDGNVYVRALRAAEDELRFEVEDDGPGIPEEEQEAIFDIFRRGTSGTGHEGTGLGLTLVRKVVEKYEGRIWVETPDEGGSRFVVSLPATRLVPRRGAPTPAPRVAPGPALDDGASRPGPGLAGAPDPSPTD